LLTEQPINKPTQQKTYPHEPEAKRFHRENATTNKGSG